MFVNKAELDWIALKVCHQMISQVHYSVVVNWTCILHSVENGFPTNPAAKRDVTLSILAAILLVSLVVCALLPKHRISCPCLRRPKDDESGIPTYHLHSYIPRYQ